MNSSEFNYEGSTWGKGHASLSWSSPSRFRLNQCRKLLKDLSQGSNVLEIGCGAGQFIRSIKAMFPNLECYGSDISQVAIEKARSLNDGVSYSISTSIELPYENDFFDVIIICDVLEHVDSPELILREGFRVIKKNVGVFYAAVPCEGDLLSLLYWLQKLHITDDLAKIHAGHIQKFSRKSLFQLFNNYQFNPVHVSYSEHFLGQLLNAATYIMINRTAKKQGISQMNNEAFFENLYNEKSSALLSLARTVINTLVNLESWLLNWFPSPNVHICGSILKHR